MTESLANLKSKLMQQKKRQEKKFSEIDDDKRKKRKKIKSVRKIQSMAEDQVARKFFHDLLLELKEKDLTLENFPNRVKKFGEQKYAGYDREEFVKQLVMYSPENVKKFAEEFIN